MVLARLFKPRAEAQAGQALYASAAAQARDAAFYRELGAADTAEGRFELFSLHVALLLLRLKGQGPRAAEIGQGLFEAYVRSLDDALREMGVADVRVGGRMKKLGEAFYGRMRALELALETRPELSELEALMRRTVLQGSADGRADALAGYAARAADHLAAKPLDGLLEGRADWPQVSP
jgi:cytochrome b pre-mRNA-processing protein 3